MNLSRASPQSGDLADLRRQLDEAQQVLQAISGGEVDALVIQTVQGKRIYTLQGADEPYRLMVEQMREGAVTLSGVGTILYTNRCFAQMLGRPLNRVIGSNIRDYLDDPDRFTQAVLNEQTDRLPGECELHSEQGTRVPVQISVVKLDIQDQACFCLTVVDLTLQRRQEQLRQSEARFRLVAEALPQIVWTAHVNGDIDYFNCRWHEYTSAAVGQESRISDGNGLSDTFCRVVHPDDVELTRSQWRRAIVDQRMYEIEHRLRRFDGVFRWHLSRALPIRNQDGDIFTWFGTSTDIELQKSTETSLRSLTTTLEARVTERTELAERRARQLLEAAAELAQAEQRERRRLAHVLHDHLQQLLVAAKMKAGAASDALDDPRRALQQVHEVKDLVDAAIRCSRDLTAELCPPVLAACGLLDAVRWLTRQMRQKYELQVKLDLELSGDIVLSDPVRDFMFFTARELLFNVVKHSGSLQACLTLRSVDQKIIELLVEDEGRGCDTRRSLTPGLDSQNFGLFNIRHRAELWNGEFELHSEPGGGCQAVLRVPWSLATCLVPEVGEPLAQASEEDSELISAPRIDRIRLVVADDHAILRHGLVALLSQQPDLVVVGEAADGHEAVELVRSLQPDVVLMDVTMPRMGGIEATSIVHRQSPSVRVIGLSMHDDAETDTAMRRAGAHAFLTKGKDFDLLMKAIRGACPCQ